MKRVKKSLQLNIDTIRSLSNIPNQKLKLIAGGYAPEMPGNSGGIACRE
jgi:hypothetical protein